MQPPDPDMTPHLRLLECWLPLVQELNATYGWEAEPQAVEQLICAAVSALATVTTVAEARAIFVQIRRQTDAQSA